MSEFITVIGLVLLWIVLSRWVLPRFGVPT
jgi:hypothetical protein